MFYSMPKSRGIPIFRLVYMIYFDIAFGMKPCQGCSVGLPVYATKFGVSQGKIKSFSGFNKYWSVGHKLRFPRR